MSAVYKPPDLGCLVTATYADLLREKVTPHGWCQSIQKMIESTIGGREQMAHLSSDTPMYLKEIKPLLDAIF